MGLPDKSEGLAGLRINERLNLAIAHGLFGKR